MTLPPETLATPTVPDSVLVQLWDIVRATPFFLGLCHADTPERLAGFAARLGARLRVHKLVIADPAGGIRSAGAEAPLSFMDEGMTAQLLAAGEAESAGLEGRRGIHAHQRLSAGAFSAHTRLIA